MVKAREKCASFFQLSARRLAISSRVIGNIKQWGEHWVRVFGTDPDRNRVLEKPPPAELIPCRGKPLRRTRLLRDPAQTQVWSEQVWLNTTFILQGSRSWDKLAVKITILHIIITTISILNLRSKKLRQEISAHTQCINKYWKYTQIFAVTKSSKIIKY